MLNEFVDLEIELDSEIDYRALAKFMVASEQGENNYFPKQEVVIHEAAIEGDVLTGYAYNHPSLVKVESTPQPSFPSPTIGGQPPG